MLGCLGIQMKQKQVCMCLEKLFSTANKPYRILVDLFILTGFQLQRCEPK